MRSFLFIAVVLAACGKGSSKSPPPSSKPVATPAAPTDKATQPSTAPAAWNAKGCPDGWSAKMKEWMGMGSTTVTVACKAGVPTLTVSDDEPRGDEGSTMSHAISKEVWEGLWKHLEMASWRELEAGCADKDVPSQVAQGITDLELVITDGKATKTLKCLAMNLTTQHEEIINAFDKAVAIAHGDPST